MMSVTVVIATHGDPSWAKLAKERAYPSACEARADEVLIAHVTDATRAEVRNALVEDAEGDYIVTLDGDDELSPGYCDGIRLEWNLSVGGGAHIPLVVPKVQYVNGHRTGAPHFLPVHELWEDNWMVVGTAFHRETFLEAGGWRTLTGTGVQNEADDWDLWIRMVEAGCDIVYAEDAVYRAFIDKPSAHRSARAGQRRKWAEEIRSLHWPDRVFEGSRR